MLHLENWIYVSVTDVVTVRNS